MSRKTLFLWFIKLVKHKLLLIFSGLPIHSWVPNSHCAWSLFIIHNSLKSDLFFNPSHIYSIFSRIHVFQGPSFFGFMYFRVQVFKGPRLSGCRSRVKVQVLEVALCIDMEITLRHRCSPVNFLHISEHLFMRIPLKDCLCMFKLWIFITSIILHIMWTFIFFH